MTSRLIPLVMQRRFSQLGLRINHDGIATTLQLLPTCAG
jgi:hypothetical protein